MQVVLLAAGMGLRLGHLTRATPKALISLHGETLVDYTLPHLLANRRVQEVIVVGGFEFDRLQSHLRERYAAFGDRVRVIDNPRFTQGNLFTVSAALPYVEGSFLICNVDHIFQEKTWKFILNERDRVTIFCDFLRSFQDDEMKVLLDEQKKLMDISKKLQVYDCAYVGLTYIPADSLEAYKNACEKTRQEVGVSAVAENVLPRLASQGQEIQVIPFDKHRWYEVDTRQDLAQAERALAEFLERASYGSID
jgi:choline kinase